MEVNARRPFRLSDYPTECGAWLTAAALVACGFLSGCYDDSTTGCTCNCHDGTAEKVLTGAANDIVKVIKWHGYNTEPTERRDPGFQRTQLQLLDILKDISEARATLALRIQDGAGGQSAVAKRVKTASSGMGDLYKELKRGGDFFGEIASSRPEKAAALADQYRKWLDHVMAVDEESRKLNTEIVNGRGANDHTGGKD